ncbi:MAG: HIRAN domain-containing protein [Verrucomicrobiales bacterium]|nr:HIRAN domain-containing protein [Verrucomicrobiales bacterium]
MKSLFLAWQAPERSPRSRAWFPVGRLDVENGVSSDEKHYRFRYTGGALSAQKEVGFNPLISFPEFEKDYHAEKLFPLFKNRVLSEKRSDFPEYIDWLDLTPEEADPISILAVSGGDRVTDNLEVFPKIVPNKDGSFNLRFFLHGLRHLGDAAVERARELKVGEELRIMIELNNPKTRLAIPILTDDYQMLGWAPRYLVEDLLTCVPSAPEITARVAKVNYDHAPLNQSILIDYSGQAPDGCGLMDSYDFKPL